MSKSLSRALLRSSSLIILISSSVTLSSAAFANDPLEVVVTADRSEVPLKNTGSAITVITSEEIEKYGSKNIADVLRTVPGLSLAETGGLGAATTVGLRGASSGSTLVLLDGVRIADTTNTEGNLDFGNFSAANVERIEILRGPQSALYGSDAMGGVINIITKKGRRTPQREVTVEGGSYGTIATRGSLSGATDKRPISFGLNALHSDGFPRYGYRVSGDPFPKLTPNPELKNNAVDKLGFNSNISYQFNDDLILETGFSYYANNIEFPNPSAASAAYVFDPNNYSQAEILNGFVRAKFSAFGGALKNQITVFGNKTDRESWQTYYYLGLTGTGIPWQFSYFGKRIGFEYQGDIELNSAANLTFGVRRESEFAMTGQSPATAFIPINATQTTNSIFAIQRVAVTDRLDVSFGGRVDAVENGQTFPTWRSTFAYRIDEASTKIRGAIGTGAKAASLFQRFSEYGTAGLSPEKSFGTEFGIDHTFAAGRANLSATLFETSYENKIDYTYDEYDYEDEDYPLQLTFRCLPSQQYTGCYYNLAQAHSRGLELAGDIQLPFEDLSLKATYTLMNARNTTSDLSNPNPGRQLYRIPRQFGSISLIYSGLQKWQFEPRVTIVGDRLDIYFDPVTFASSVITLPSYLKLDFLTRYKLNDSNEAYIRFENLTDAHTEDAYNFGSAGRSVYVGWTTRF